MNRKRLVLCALLLVSCVRARSGGIGGGGAPDLAPDDAGAPDSAAPDDAGDRYADLGESDSGQCLPGEKAMSCASALPVNAGCGAAELCGSDGTGNGLDDDCNGLVDDGCACVPGQVEKCFLGPPGKRDVGACSDGTQTCFGEEFGTWGSCLGSISPSTEVCDALDNDCDGCADDGLCCGGILDCPGPGDPRIAPVLPYIDVPLKGELFFLAPAISWSWTVVGGPCDRLFATTTGNPPQQSFTLNGTNNRDATVHFTLSGDYTVTLTVVGSDGNTYTCTWIQHVAGPGVRFELCWDHTGASTDTPPGADLDLHVHRPGTTTKWFETSSGVTNLDDCYYMDCNPDSYLGCSPGSCSGTASWGYSASPIQLCQGAPPTEDGDTWTNTVNDCPSPRQDMDNIETVGKAENINIDSPKNGDTFRAMVHYYGQDGDTSTNKLEVHPIVNVYCGGTLKATYGAAPNTLGPCPGSTCFNNGQGYAAGQMWRVADVQATVDPTTGATTDCTVTALHPTGTTSGYWVTNNNISY